MTLKIVPPETCKGARNSEAGLLDATSAGCPGPIV